MFAIGGSRMLVAGALFTALAAGCGGSGEAEGDDDGSSSTVEVVDARFVPKDLTVKVGDTVRWNFTGRLPHSVVGDFGAGEVQSERFTGSGTYEVTFATAGRFEYHCGVHTTRMLGTIIVE